MEIRWAPNPLKTAVVLNDNDRAWFRERLMCEELRSRICDAYFELTSTPGTPITSTQLEKVLRALDLNYALGDSGEIDETIDRRLALYEAALSGEHNGDCVSEASTCTKCCAEEVLGVDTIQGLGREAVYINSAFKNGETFEGAIAWLTNYTPRMPERWRSVRNEKDFAEWAPKWTESAKRALEWLRAYGERGGC